MTLSGFSNTFVGIMLGWLKGVANWVLRLFNLAGNTGVSPLLWLSQNWAKLLVLFLFIGVAVDILVWLIRWRPYWVWFHKERVIVNDEKFFAGGRIDHQRFTPDDDMVEDDWAERDFVVTSTVARKPEYQEKQPEEPREETPRRGRSESTRIPARVLGKHPKRRSSVGTIVKRGKAAEGQPEAEPPQVEEIPEDAFLFGVDVSQSGVTDSYEDEVFNVNSLPKASIYDEDVDDLFSFDEDE